MLDVKELKAESRRLADDWQPPGPKNYKTWVAVPAELKTKACWLDCQFWDGLFHRLKAEYQPVATVTEIYAVPRRKHRGVEAIPAEELPILQKQFFEGTLSVADAARLQRAGHLHSYNLYHRNDTTVVSLDGLTITEADQVFERLCYKGTDRDRYIVENYKDDGKKERSTWQNCFSDPDFLKHLRGERSYGIRKGKFTHLIIVDFDRHSGLILGKDHRARVLAFLAFVKEKLPDFRVLVEVNPRNGSTKFFLFSRTAIPCKNSPVIKLIREFLGDDSMEVYPDNLFQAFLLGRADKTTIGNRVIPRIRRKRYETVNGKRKLRWVESFSTKAILEHLLSVDPVDPGVVEKYLDAGIAACPDSTEPPKAVVPVPKIKKTTSTESSGMGSLPKFKGNTLAYLAGLYRGTIKPTTDTIGKVATVLSRGFITGGMDADEALEATLDFLDNIPDPSFSDRLMSDHRELGRVVSMTCNKIEEGNGYQPDRERSSKKWELCHRLWALQGIDFCDTETWLHREYSRKGKTVKMTAQLLDFINELQSLTFADADKTRAFFEDVVRHVESKGELSISLVGVLMKKNGIAGAGKGKMVDIRHFFEDRAVLIKRHKAYWDYTNERSGQRHGDFFVLGLIVQFEEDKVVVLFTPPHTTVSIGSVHDRTEEQRQHDDMLMEARFLRCDQQWKDRRTRLGLWPQWEKQAA